jgi:hypothetical protein
MERPLRDVELLSLDDNAPVDFCFGVSVLVARSSFCPFTIFIARETLELWPTAGPRPPRLS